jgi:uroporphyrinogen-III decarboxylase
VALKGLNAYCRDHSGAPDAAGPEGFYAEALALGASFTRTAGGFITPQYLYTRAEELYGLPRLDESPRIKSILADIQRAAPGKRASGETTLLKANGPYSVLASLVEPKVFYRWLGREGEAVHRGLETITAGITAYVRAAFAAGITVLSLADPSADAELLGEGRCREFAGAWLMALVEGVLAGPESRGKIIHLCPRSSLPLERCGLLQSETRSVADRPRPYTRLLEQAAESGITFAGHRCIHSGAAAELTALYCV